jgi:molybdate transport system ATP-binding protein
VLDGKVLAIDADNFLADVAVGNGLLRIHAEAQVGSRVRVQKLARDIILASMPPRGLSVRNALEGSVVRIERDDDYSDLVYVDIGGATVMARITDVATRDLALVPGSTVWVLVKAVSMRGHAIS